MSASSSNGAARPNYTPAQREAILRDGHTLLEAGAGSGKTTTLVGKILHALGARIVEAPPAPRACELSEIAAITFTTAAAADLRQSLQTRLRAYAETDDDRRWRRLVYEVDRARIGTIHSFCGQILREFALRDGRDPGFGVLDAGDAADLREECARARLYAALAADDPEANELAFQFTPHGAVRLIRDAMEKGDAARQAQRAWCDPDGRANVAALQASVERLGGVWRTHDGDGARLAALVLRLAHEARDAFDEQLDQQGALDYDALISRTRDLLVRSPGALAGFRRRLRWLFIDEFQDTDPAQRDIAYAICGVRDALDGAAPRDCPSLCIVGDPKQSIYGFRRADVTLWNAVAREFAALGIDVIPLDQNFRSRAPLLGLVNGTFASLMPAVGDEARPDYEVRYRPLTPARDYAGDDGLVELLVLPDGETAGDRRRDEAARIARRIRAMVDDREPVVWDGEGDRQPVRWRDVALLFRSSTDVRLYEAELRRLRVPCYVAAGDGFFATREVRDVRLLLTALADAHDDVAWVGLLRSPFVGLTDDALYRLRLARPTVSFSAALDVELPGADGEALAFAREWLDELRRLRDRVPCAALIERALERSGYAATILYQEGGDVALANVRKLVRIADGRPDESFAGMVAYLLERGESSAREGEAALHTAGEDVVTLTTVHGAKGLEWPVVFLVDLDRETGAANNTPQLFVDAALGIGIKLQNPDPDIDKDERLCGAYECLRDEAARRDRAEELRVWYVASTRARDRLVLCAKLPAVAAVADGDKQPKATPARLLLGGVGIDGEALRYSCGSDGWQGAVIAEVAEVAALPRLAPPRFDEVAADASESPTLARRLRAVRPVVPLFRRSATELMVFARDRDEHRRSYLLGLRPSPFAARAPRSAGAGNGTRLDARTTGDIVHVVMELEREAVARDLDRILEREIGSRMGTEAAASIAPEAVARLRRLIEQTHAHESVARLFAGEAVERELPFTWFLDVDGELSVVHGAMDLVARVGAVLEILDFKTHQLEAGEEAGAAAKYELQRDAYAAALAEIVGVPAAFSFFFPETSAEVRHALDEGAVAAGRARLCTVLREVMDAVGAGARATREVAVERDGVTLEVV